MLFTKTFLGIVGAHCGVAKEPIEGDNAISTVADIGCFAGSQLEWKCNSRLETVSQNQEQRALGYKPAFIWPYIFSQDPGSEV